ncbi:MAG: ATP-binding protein [Actinomycetes bacterium]
MSVAEGQTTPPAARHPRRLQRRVSGRMLAGVCRGLAEHLGVDVRWVRLAVVVLTLANGAGLVVYAGLWIFAPLARDETGPQERESFGGVLALGVLGVALLLVMQVLGLGLPRQAVLPLAVGGVGLGLLWRQADDAQRARWRGLADPSAVWGTRQGRAALARALLGVLLVLAGIAALVARRTSLAQAAALLVAVLIVLGGVLLIAAPWALRLARDLRDERAARIREQERAEVAAHVHDSVLHTLALIQRQVDDPHAVARLARSQERDLRQWLYQPARTSARVMVAEELASVAAGVEDLHGVTIEVVCVGDHVVDAAVGSALSAAREALVNAAKYAGSQPISCYAEVSGAELVVSVRDRGPGFDPAAVPADRMGVRESIVGRMQRAGGAAVLRRLDPGTEVELTLPLSPPAAAGTEASASPATPDVPTEALT